MITTTLTNHNFWLREPDLNQQPLGYEPSELPDCSIPRYLIKMAEEKGFEPLRRFLDLPVFKTGPFNQTWVFLHLRWCLRPESNRHGLLHPQDFKSCASTYSATQAYLDCIVFLLNNQVFLRHLYQKLTEFFHKKWCPVGDSNSRPFD